MTVFVNTINKGTVNMRENPNRTAKILAQIPYRTSLEAESVNNEWSKVSYGGKIGYVMSEFLTSVQPITRKELEQVYNSLQSTLAVIEKILK